MYFVFHLSLHLQGGVQEREDQHGHPRQGHQQVPAGLLQPSQEQHGRAEAAEKTEAHEGRQIAKYLI